MSFKYREIEKKLRKLGFIVVRQKGSHVLFSNGEVTFPVPNHGIVVFLFRFKLKAG